MASSCGEVCADSEFGMKGKEKGRKRRCARQINSRKRGFLKRRNRLFRKAHELSVLCDAEVAAVVFSPWGKMSEFASSSTSHVVKRYQNFQPQMPSNDELLHNVERSKHEPNLSTKKITQLHDFHRWVFEGNTLPSSINEAKCSEEILEDALVKINRRKSALLQVEVQKIIENGERLYKDNNLIHGKLTQMLSSKECTSRPSSE